MYNLACGLIDSSSNPSFKTVLFSPFTPNVSQQPQPSEVVNLVIGDPSTLIARLRECTWPKRCVQTEKIATDNTFIEP
jgi:hypothetical protein